MPGGGSEGGGGNLPRGVGVRRGETPRQPYCITIGMLTNLFETRVCLVSPCSYKWSVRVTCGSMRGYMKETLLRVRLDPQLGNRLSRLRKERDINVSAWVRRLIRNALDYELPAEDQHTAPASTAPLPGWKPARLPDGSWGSLYAGPDPNDLPHNLKGLTISVQARNGKSWEATVTEVVERSSDRVLVRDRKLDQ